MQIHAQLIGYPRIRPKRELKWALERAWSGRIKRSDFEARLAGRIGDEPFEVLTELARGTPEREAWEMTCERFSSRPRRMACASWAGGWRRASPLARGRPDSPAW